MRKPCSTSIRLASFVAALAAVTFTIGASAETFDSSQAFSKTLNPNPVGGWSYGHYSQGPEDPRSFVPFARNFSQDGLWYWTHGEFAVADYRSFIVANGTHAVLEAPTEPGASVTSYPPGSLGLHPSRSLEPAALRWTAPYAGDFEIDALFVGGHPSTSATVHVVGNGTHMAGFQVHYGSPSRFDSCPLRLAKGDVVDLVVSPAFTPREALVFLEAKISTVSPLRRLELMIHVPECNRQPSWMGHKARDESPQLPPGQRRNQPRKSLEK